ncbi:MAG: hypothetical protein AAFZ06_07765 [Pseudomonadota bacterium]
MARHSEPELGDARLACSGPPRPEHSAKLDARDFSDRAANTPAPRIRRHSTKKRLIQVISDVDNDVQFEISEFYIFLFAINAAIPVAAKIYLPSFGTFIHGVELKWALTVILVFSLNILLIYKFPQKAIVTACASSLNAACTLMFGGAAFVTSFHYAPWAIYGLYFAGP